MIENPVVTETFGNKEAERPDVMLICQHDGNAEAFLEQYPQLLEPYKKDPEILHRFLELERDIGAAQVAKETAKELEEISKGEIRIDLLKVDIPRGIIDPNRRPEDESDSQYNPSRVHVNPIRRVFDHEACPDLLREFQAIHRRIVTEMRAALNRLAPGGLFFDIHIMWDHDIKETEVENGAIIEGPSIEELKKYMDKITAPGGKERAINILTKFVDEDPIAHMGLVESLESGFDRAGIRYKRNHPYSYLGFSMCSQFALQKPHQGTTIDIPTHEVSGEGKSDYIKPELDDEKIKEIAHINAQAIWENLQAA